MGFFDRLKKENRKTELQSKAPKQAGKRRAGAGKKPPKKKILFVCRDENRWEPLDEFLIENGYDDVAIYDEPTGAIDEFISHSDKYDLVLLDMEQEWSKTSGIETMVAMKKYNAEVPIILTAVPSGLRTDARRAGASDIVVGKNYEKEALLEAIRKAIG